MKTFFITAMYITIVTIGAIGMVMGVTIGDTPMRDLYIALCIVAAQLVVVTAMRWWANYLKELFSK